MIWSSTTRVPQLAVTFVDFWVSVENLGVQMLHMCLFCVLLLLHCVSKASLGKLSSYRSFHPTLTSGWRPLAWVAGCLLGFDTFLWHLELLKCRVVLSSEVLGRSTNDHAHLSGPGELLLTQICPSQQPWGSSPTAGHSSKDFTIFMVVLLVTGKCSGCTVWLRGTDKAIAYPAAPQRAHHKA